MIAIAINQSSNDIHQVNSRFHKKINILKNSLILLLCHNTCFRHSCQVSNLPKSATLIKNNENDNNYYNSNKITIMR